MMSAGPSIMATVGLDASGVNAGAAKVVSKVREMGKATAAAAKTSSGTAAAAAASVALGPAPTDLAAWRLWREQAEKQIKIVEQAETKRAAVSQAATSVKSDDRRLAGMASDPIAVIEGEKIAERKAKRLAALKDEERQVGIATERAMRAEEKAAERTAAKRARDGEKARAQGRKDAEREEARRERDAAKREHAEAKASKSSSALGGAAKMMGAYLTVDFLARQTKNTIKYGSEVSDLAARLSMSTTAAQQWDYALSQNGSSLADNAKTVEYLGMSMQKAKGGDKKLAASLAQLGVTSEQIQASDVSGAMASIARSFETKDGEQLIGAWRHVGGSAAGEMVAAFKSGLTQLFAEAPVIPPETIEQLDIIDDKFAAIAASFKTGMAEAIVGIVEVVGPVFEAFKIGIAGAIGYFESSFKGIKSVFFGGDTAELFNLLLGKTGMEGAGQAIVEYREGLADQKRRKEEAKAKKKPFGGGADFDADGEAKGETKLSTLRESLRRKEEANALIGLKPEERKAELLRRRAALMEKITATTSEEQKLKQQNELADLDRVLKQEDAKDRAAAERRQKDERIAALNEEQTLLKDAAKPHAVSALQQMGGFLGNFASSAAPEVALLNSQLRVLEKIEAHLRGKGGGSGEEAEVIY